MEIDECRHCGCRQDPYTLCEVDDLTDVIDDLRKRIQSLQDGAETALDLLLMAMRDRNYPNCTAYIIWHYLQSGKPDEAYREYVRDSDKLGELRAPCETALRSRGIPA